MTTMRTLGLSGVGLVLCLTSGCVGGWHTVWTQKEDQTVTFDQATLSSLDVVTHNGRIQIEGQPDDTGQAVVVATKKAGAMTLGSAREALEAIEIFVEPRGEGEQVLGWRWRERKHWDWRGRVDFDDQLKSDVDLDIESHNGRLDVAHIAGDVRAVTHNGSINVSAEGDTVFAKTHNGEIQVEAGGAQVTLRTHNGRITADLSRCKSVTGSVVSHNGRIKLTLDPEASVRLRCRTHNGRIRSNLPMTTTEIGRRSLDGTVGAGEGKLAVTTHNGGIALENSKG